MAYFEDSLQIGEGLILGPVSDSCLPIVVGIDFGAAYSGVAFAFKSDPGTIASGAPTALDVTQSKVPTALLELPDGTWEFGYAAEAKYNETLTATNAGTQPAAHLYKRFKMVLKGKNSGFDTLTALSINGKSRSLMDLTVRSLQFLMDFAISEVTGGFGGDVVPNRDVQWVLTVPAIWNDFGKAFMRKAAFKAGLMENEQSDNLMLVLEPEGASLAVHVGAAQFGLLGAGSRFMVLDGGGGTIDFTVHEVLTLQPLTMKAIAAPSGGDWGGDYVNMEFKKFLAELLGDALYRESEMPFEFYTIRAEFDRVKITFDPSKDPGNIRLIEVLNEKKQLVALAAAYNLNHPDKPILSSPALRNGFLAMSKALMLSFFEPFLLATVDETRRVMKEVPGVRHIMVVGGFGSSIVLMQRIRAEFHNRGGVKVILPDTRPKPQAAVVHGAVYFGLHKDIVQSRLSPYTYGIAVREDGVDEVFFALVRKGEELAHDHEAGFFALPAKANQSAMTWRVYRSDMVNPATVIGEHLLGCLTAVCPPDPIAVNRRQKVTLCFGGSEIRVTIENTKGEIVKGEISMDGDGAYGRCIAVSGGSRTDSNLQQGAASEPVPAKPRSLESPPLPPASGSDTPATSSYGVLQSDYERLVSEAALAKQRREVERRLHNNASKLSTAKRTKNITLVVSTRSEEVSLEQEKVSVFAAISEEQCAALPSKIQDLLDRLFVFSLDIDVKILRDSDVDILGRVEEMYLSAQQALQALTLQPPQPRSGPGVHAAPAAYYCGKVLIADVKPVLGTSGGAAAPRMILRGHFATVDGVKQEHQYDCIIKCAPQDATAQPCLRMVAKMYREHLMYKMVQDRGTECKRPTGCVRMYSVHPTHHYLVLQYHGTDLRALLSPKRFFPQQAVEAIVSAVHALHSLDIMHGDIKPDNLLCRFDINGNCHVRLCGLSAVHKVGEICEAATLGTVHYQAPELRRAAARGSIISASLKLDMFALGLVLWQVVTRSPRAALDRADADDLHSSQENLDGLVRYPPFYKAVLHNLISINATRRTNIAELYVAIKTLSASSAQRGLLHEKEENKHLKRVVYGKLDSISEKLDKIDIKLDRVLQELRIRFDALGSTAVQVAESLRKEILLGGEQLPVLTNMMQAMQDALRSISSVSSRENEARQSHAATSAAIERCMLTMQTSVDAAVTRALAQQKIAGVEGFEGLARQLQGRFLDLTSELWNRLEEQRQSGLSAADQRHMLSSTSDCLKTGLETVVQSLNDVKGALQEVKLNQVNLGKQVSQVLVGSAELRAMVRALTENTHDMPTLAIVLPAVSTSWKSKFSPMRLVRDQYRLYFLCSHTKQLAPCGPQGKGYKITMTKQWVLDAAPVLRVGLVLLKLALMATTLPLPVPDLCSALIDNAMHVQYLNAALHLVMNPPDALGQAEFVMEQALDAIDAHDIADVVKDALKKEGCRKAYETIKLILDGVNIPLTCGLRKVTHGGKTAWVLDNDATEQDWRSAVNSAAP